MPLHSFHCNDNVLRDFYQMFWKPCQAALDFRHDTTRQEVADRILPRQVAGWMAKM